MWSCAGNIISPFDAIHFSQWPEENEDIFSLVAMGRLVYQWCWNELLLSTKLRFNSKFSKMHSKTKWTSLTASSNWLRGRIWPWIDRKRAWRTLVEMLSLIGPAKDRTHRKCRRFNETIAVQLISISFNSLVSHCQLCHITIKELYGMSRIGKIA